MLLMFRELGRGFSTLDKAETPAERGETWTLETRDDSAGVRGLSDGFELMFGVVYLGDLFGLREPEGG